MKDNLKKTGITVIPNDEEKYHKTFRMKSFYKENCKKPYLVYVDLYVPADEFNFSKKAIKVLFEFDGEIIINETEEKILMAV